MLPKTIKAGIVVCQLLVTIFYTMVLIYWVHAVLNWKYCRLHVVIGIILLFALMTAEKIAHRTTAAKMIRADLCPWISERVKTRYMLLACTVVIFILSVYTYSVAYIPQDISEDKYDIGLLAYSMSQTETLEEANTLHNFLYGFPVYTNQFYIGTLKDSNYEFPYSRMELFCVLNALMLIYLSLLRYTLRSYQMFTYDILETATEAIEQITASETQTQVVESTENIENSEQDP